MSSNKCFYLTYFFFIYYLSKMPLREEQSQQNCFIFDGHTVTEEGSHITSSSQSQFSGQSNFILTPTSTPCLDRLVGGCSFTKLSPIPPPHLPLILLFF